MNGQTLNDEAGTTDNRLSLSPGDHPEIQEWQDGQTYRLNLTVTQMSPGEFRVDDMQTQEAAPEEGAESGAEEPMAPEMEMGQEPANSEMAPGGGGYTNPVVAKVMRRR